MGVSSLLFSLFIGHATVSEAMLHRFPSLDPCRGMKERGYTTIHNIFELKRSIESQPDGHFVLCKSLDARDISSPAERDPRNASVIEPSGGFAGRLDGNGFGIKTLQIPLFNQITPSGVIENLHVTARIDLNNCASEDSEELVPVGPLARTNFGRVIRVTGAGEVTTYGRSGGLVGDNHGLIDRSSFFGLVRARSTPSAGSCERWAGRRIGGLTGLHSGAISRSFTGGELIGTSHLGGLAGLLVKLPETRTAYSEANECSPSASNARPDCWTTASYSTASLLTENMENDVAHVGGLLGSVEASLDLRSANLFSYSLFAGVISTPEPTRHQGAFVGTIGPDGPLLGVSKSADTPSSFFDGDLNPILTEGNPQSRSSSELREAPSARTFSGWETLGVWYFRTGHLPILVKPKPST